MSTPISGNPGTGEAGRLGRETIVPCPVSGAQPEAVRHVSYHLLSAMESHFIEKKMKAQSLNFLMIEQEGRVWPEGPSPSL